MAVTSPWAQVAPDTTAAPLAPVQMPDAMSAPQVFASTPDSGVDLHAGLAKIFPPSAAPMVKLDPNQQHQVQGAFANGNDSEAIKLHDQNKLAKDYQKDADPYGSPDNHPGFFGKLAHALSHATGGDTRRGWEEQGLAKQINAQSADDAALAHTGAETAGLEESTKEAPGKAASEEGLQGAETGHTEAETAAMQNPQYEVHDTAAGPLFVNKKTGAAQHLSVDGLPVGPKIQTKTIPLQIGGKPHQVLINDETGDPIRDLGESGEKPPVTNVNAGTWSVQTDTSGNPILLNSKTGETKPAPPNLARKPNAEEQKRADLAQNVNENLNTLEDIVNRRPDLFGPVAGRMTKGKQAIGTDDPDVATLKTVEDNLGMAMQSAHGMRSASHVETSAQSVLNGFNNEPKALLASIKAARDSVGTFQQNVENTNEAGKPQSGGSGNSTPIVQQSPSTGKFRYSTDGGKTWQAGQPKQ